jgi:hypothetical protein
VSCGAALDSAGVDPDLVNPIDIERDAPIRFEGATVEHDGDGFNTVRGFCWLECHVSVSTRTQDCKIEKIPAPGACY